MKLILKSSKMDKILELIKESKAKKWKAWENYIKICKEEDNKLSNLIDFSEKYLKIDDCGDIIYIKVRRQVQCSYLDTDKPGLQLIGPGFTKSNDNYYFCMDIEYTYQFDLTDKIDNIQEITKEEFDNILTNSINEYYKNFKKVI